MRYLGLRYITRGLVASAQFDVNGNVYHIYDFGGAKCERSKWIGCFDNVAAVIYVASLSCFDQGLYETSGSNGMIEALQLWDEIVNGRWFNKRTAMVLFLNKPDLLRTKLQDMKKDLGMCFEGKIADKYDGDNSYSDAVNFMKQQFLRLNENANERIVYCHVKC